MQMSIRGEILAFAFYSQGQLENIFQLFCSSNSLLWGDGGPLTPVPENSPWNFFQTENILFEASTERDISNVQTF